MISTYLFYDCGSVPEFIKFLVGGVAVYTNIPLFSVGVCIWLPELTTAFSVGVEV